MANIQPYIDQIQNATYGEEVRSSIINALEMVNADNESYQEIKEAVVDAKDTVEEVAENISDQISTADGLATTLEGDISVGQQVKSELEDTTTTAQQTKGGLDSSITAGTTLKGDLEDLAASGSSIRADVEASAQTATQKATEASQSASTAVQAKNETVTAKNTAVEASQTAVTKAGEASTSASTATQKAGEASQSAQTAVQAKDIAVTKANEADQSATTAVQAKDEAETARDTAVASAQSVSASAQQIQTNKNDISAIKTDLNEIIETVEPVNLWNGAYTDNTWINASYQVVAVEGYILTDYFDVMPNRYVCLTRKATPTTRMIETTGAVTFFDADKNPLYRVGSVSTRLAPANARYARWNIPSAYKTYDLMIEYCDEDGSGISATYQDYFEPYRHMLSTDFAEKKICAFGDSIASSDNGDRNAVTWIDLVKEYFGASEAYNRGIGASCVTSTNAQGEARTGYAYVDADGDAGEIRVVYSTQRTFANYPTEINPCMDTVARANTIPTDTDVVVIIAGTNDIGTTTLEMFENAYRTMLNNIITRVPNAKIYPCTMPFQQSYDLGDTATKAVYENYRNVIRNVASDYGLPCIDLRKDMFINARNYQTYMNDATHYNTSAGRKRIAECVIATLKGYSCL